MQEVTDYDCVARDESKPKSQQAKFVDMSVIGGEFKPYKQVNCFKAMSN